MPRSSLVAAARIPAGLLVLQCAVLAVPAISFAAAYVCMAAAPALAAVAALWRARHESGAARLSWSAVALAMLLWAAGALGNLRQELLLGRFNEMYRESMLAFNLVAVPIAALLASEWRFDGRWLARGLDALLALALGYAYFRVTWAMLTGQGASPRAGVEALVWLYDLQNAVLAAGALVRWHVAQEREERDLFRALAVYATLYLVIAFVNNHVFAGDPAYGPQYGTISSIPFAALGAAALYRSTPPPRARASARLARAVESACPMVLGGALLLVSLFLIRVDYALGVTGVLIAVAGYGARSIASQVRHIEHGEALQQERSRLQAIAWTDALTGIPNRRFLDQELAWSWRWRRRGDRPVAMLMIDIDFFKQLNDRYGHIKGDDCLREVARALRQTLGRPDDVLARFGGEEFVALLRDTDGAGARAVAERLRAAVEAMRIEHGDSPFGVVTVSIGAVSGVLHGAGSAAGLVAAADKALYEAKCTGRNAVRLQEAPAPAQA